MVEQKEVKPTPDLNTPIKASDQKIRANVSVLAVEETLVMPNDYLTTAMTVKTKKNDTLIFTYMDGYEALIGKEITIEYKLTAGSKILICFDCSSYSKAIDLHDHTAFPSEIEYQELKLNNYREDEYIVVNSNYDMIDKSGASELFTAMDSDMILDSLKMKNAFYTYGIITNIHPELLNKNELEKLIKQD